MRILLVEDEPNAARMLAKGLREQTYAVDVAGDGEAALYQTSINDYDLIVLDVMLPLKDGFEVCRELRAAGATTPILMLTARDGVQDRIAGLDTGADDYLTKPFDFHELLARIRALLRRGQALQPQIIEITDLQIDARADAGRRELQKSTFYLDELLDEAARAARVLASRKGVGVELATAGEAPFHGDEGLLRQMILNLLDNAIKHTPAGGQVSLKLLPRDENYLITVSDTGAGIPPEAQPQIFERFYRADKARARAESGNGGGVGLGLSIAQWVAQAHGGSLRLQKSDEHGSVFVISLPNREAKRDDGTHGK